MCGIIGYTGKSNTLEILLEGLKKLEYRGYDSAGVALSRNDSIAIRKATGTVDVLKKTCEESPLCGNTGIGHTRWATHGRVNTVNSHPHTNLSGTIAVVHNGIVENYTELYSFLTEQGYRFVSETDSEAIPHLIDFYMRQEQDFFKAFLRAVNGLKGSFAIAVTCSCCEEKIYAARKGSPLVAAKGTDESFLCSDMYSLPREADSIYMLEDNEVSVLTPDRIEFFDFSGKEIEKTSIDFNMTEPLNSSNTEYSHYMIKEIYEQPDTVRRILKEANKNGSFTANGLNADDLKRVDRIYIVGCGTAYNAAKAGKLAIEYLSGISTQSEIASQFCCGYPLVDKNTLVIAVTQSGETADTLSAIRFAKQKGARVLSVTNTVHSTASDESDFTFYTNAGREISVASTKAYTAQLAALYVIALFLGENRNHAEREQIEKFKKAFLDIPEKIEKALLIDGDMKELAKKISCFDSMYYIGRGIDSITADEGALKMKEISYIHAEAYPAGELKHGPIALVDCDLPVVAVSLCKRLHLKTVSNIKEVSSRGGQALCFFEEDKTSEFPNTYFLPETDELFSVFTGVIPMQLLAYYTALEKGYDVDKPRNLAKSVTVE